MNSKKQLRLSLLQFQDMAQHIQYCDATEILQTYLDSTTGEIVQYSNDTHVPLGFAADLSDSKMQEFEEEKTLEEQIRASPNRYLKLGPIDSVQSFHFMEQFIETLGDKNIKGILARAIKQKGPFRRFKDALLEFPIIREHWFCFEEKKYQEYILEWLSGMGIEVLLLPNY